MALSAYLHSSAACGTPSEAPPVARLLHDPSALASWLRAHAAEPSAATARIAQARAGVDAARLLPNPTLDATLSDVVVGTSNPAGLGFNETAMYTVGLSETIELGKRGPRVDGALLRVDSAKRAADATLQDRVAAARGALGRVVYVRAKQALLEDALASAKKAAEVERTRLDQGALSGTDFDRIELERMSLEADVARSRAEVAGALSACRAALYAPCEGVRADIAELDHAAPVPATAGADGLERRPDVLALRLERKATEKDRLLAERRALPDPSLRVAFTHDRLVVAGDQQNTLTFGLVVPLPLFDHGQADAARATARLDELDHATRATLKGAEGDLEALLARRAYLEDTLTRLTTTAQPKSAGILDVTQRAFTQGQVDLTDLLLARRTHLALLVGAMDLRFEFFAVRNDLRRVLGLDTDAHDRGDRE